MTARRECVLAVSIALAGVVLRMVRLGALSLAGDEETTALAARALLEGWPPILPGGLVYLRGLPFTALESGALALWGLDEGALRLTSVLAAGPRILAAWWLARAFLGPGLSLACAGLLAVAPLDVELSRTARMYSLFATFDLVLVAAAVHYVRGSAGARTLGWGTLAGALGVITHQLTVTHAPVAWAAALGRRVPGRRRLWLAVAGAALVAIAVVWRGLVQGEYQAVKSTAGDVASGPLSAQGAPGHIAALGDLLTAWPSAVPAAVAILLGAAGGLVAARRLGASLARVAALAAGVAFALASPVLAGAVWAGALLVEDVEGRVGLRRTGALLAGGAAATIAWGAAVLLQPAAGVEQALRFVLTFPEPNWADLAQVVPGPFLLAVGGALAAALWTPGGRGRSSGAWLALLVAFVGPLLLSGLLTRREGLRYHAHLLAPLLVFALVGARAAFQALGMRSLRWSAVAAAGLVLIAVRPDYTLSALLRDHGPVRSPFVSLGVAPDHREPGEFVRALAGADAWIVAEDPLQQTVWAGRVDVWLRRRGDARAYLRASGPGEPPRDIYTGALHAHDLDALKQMAAGREEVWVITSGEVAVAPEYYRTPEMDATLEAWKPLAWFVGRDGLSRVYRLEHGEPLPPPPALDGVPGLTAERAAALVQGSRAEGPQPGPPERARPGPREPAPPQPQPEPRP